MKTWFARIQFFKLMMLLIITLFISLLSLVPNPLYTSLEQIAYDRLVAWTSEKNSENRVTLVDIDEATLTSVGAWPWPSDKMASLLDTLLNHYQVSVLGIDIVFPDRKPDSAKLAKLLNHQAVVMSQVLDFSENSRNHTGKLITYPTHVQGDAPEIKGYIANHQDFVTDQARVGHISPIVDEDGKVRRIFPIVCQQKNCTSILSLEMFKSLHAEKQQTELKHQSLSISFNHSDETILPLDNHQALFIPFTIHADGFKYISAQSILDHHVPLERLKNSVVILGSTALGLGDYVATPSRNIVPGLELHAQIFSSILDQSFIWPKDSLWWVLAPIWMIALIFAFVSSRGARANMIWLLSSLLLVVFIQMMLFKHLHWWVPSSPSILTILLLGIMSIFHDSILVNRQLSALAQQVGRFIPDTIARRLIRGRDYSPGTEERELTVLVADMRGFTTASEGREPEKVAALAQKCLETLTQVVYQYGGTIEKFSGDGLMAIWGAPKRDAYHAKNAFDAGLMMLKKIEGLQTWFEQNGFEPMQVSIGMNTGKMAVGVFGGDSHLAWSAHGDAVNVASRIEQLTREVGLPILLGARTAELIGIDLLQYCGEFKVKGRQQTVQVYSPMQQ